MTNPHNVNKGGLGDKLNDALWLLRHIDDFAPDIQPVILKKIESLTGLKPSQDEGSDLVEDGLNATIDIANPPLCTCSNCQKLPTSPTSINEILEGFEVIETNHLHHHEHDKDKLKTALYTLIASKAPKKKTHPNELSMKSLDELIGYNQALQDYDNAIKEALK